MSSSNVSTVVNHFPTANEGFITTLGSTILSGATEVPLTTTSGLTNGTIFVGIIEPGTIGKEQTFTGTVDTGGNQITGVKWTRGSNTGHNAGVTIVDYVSGTGQNMMTKGWSVEHKQDGTHEDITADSITADTATFDSVTINGTASAEGWSPLGDVPDTVTALGNGSYSLVFNGNDLTDTVSEGMRIRTARTVAASNTSFSLDGTNDYYVKTSPNKMTWTDDFATGFWVYLTAYAPASDQVIASRYNGTSGWYFGIDVSGRVVLSGFNAASGNASYVLSYQSVPLNKWTFVAAQLDMSAFTATTTTSYVMINGVDVPASVARSGTNPTALVQAGNFEVGSANGGTLPFSGYIGDGGVFSAKVTQATMLTYMNQPLVGNESNLASGYANGSVNDLNTTTPNNLTATNGATTVANAPYGNRGASTTLDYGVVVKKAFSTNTTLTVQVPEGCTIPTSGGVASIDYSVSDVPYGFPRDKGRWRLEWYFKSSSKTSPTGGTWYNVLSASVASTQGDFVLPLGSWFVGYQITLGMSRPAASSANTYSTLATTYNNSVNAGEYLRKFEAVTRSTAVGASSNEFETPVFKESPLNVSVETPLFLTILNDTGGNNLYISGYPKIYAENAYI